MHSRTTYALPTVCSVQVFANACAREAAQQLCSVNVERRCLEGGRCATSGLFRCALRSLQALPWCSRAAYTGEPVLSKLLNNAGDEAGCSEVSVATLLSG